MNECSRMYISGNWPTLHQIYKTVETLERKHTKFLRCECIGKSVDGRKIISVRLSDFSISDADKQVIIFVAVEHGHERNGAAVLLKLIDWLINSDEGKNTLTKQIVYIVPVVNVDEYAGKGNLRNRNGVNLFCDYNFDGSTPSQPESQAVWKLLEKIKPDALASLHGLSQDELASGYHRVWESTGVAYSSQYERCYSRKVIDRINVAAEQAGFPQDLGEEDIERILPRIPGYEYHSFPSFELNATIGSYCYNRFHTLSTVMEIGTIASGFIRAREFLRIGNERWEYECYRGYPNRIITSPGISSFLVKSAGKTASERRSNRVKLWKHSNDILSGIAPYHHATVRIGLISRVYDDEQNRQTAKTIKQLLAEWNAEKAMQICRDAGILEAEAFLWNDCDRTIKETHERTPNVEQMPMAASLCLRIDKNVKVEKVILNEDELSNGQYRFWKDNRYAYVEADMKDDWQRGILLVMTTPPPGCKLFN